MNTITQILDNLVLRFKSKHPSSNFKRWEPDLHSLLVTKTNFLPSNATIKQRLWHIENKINERILCSICHSKPVSWNINEYRLFCSTKCFGGQTEIIEKRQQTMLEKYGVKNYVNHPDFNSKRTKTYLENYDVEWSLQSPVIRKQIKQTTQERYGVDCYTQSEDYRLKTQKTIIDKYDREYVSQKRINDDSFQKLNNKEWLIQKHHTEKLTLSKLGEILDVDLTTVVSYIEKHNIQKLRFPSSQPELDLIEFIHSLSINNIVINSNKIIGKQLDIYLPDYNLAIEYNGIYWHREKNKKSRAHHLNKMLECKKRNIRLLTIFENEWIENGEIVRNTIKHILGKNENSIYARKTKSVISLDKKEVNEFLEQYHLQGKISFSIGIGLKYENELVSVMTFTDYENHYMLSRFATSKRVIGGFSKLLSFFEKNYPHKPIISFADLRWSQGEVYLKNGFTIDKVLSPDYKYIIGNKLYHKFGFRHKKLKNKLNKYDPNLTEKENCDNAGLSRIWDCGKIRFVKL